MGDGWYTGRQHHYLVTTYDFVNKICTIHYHRIYNVLFHLYVGGGCGYMLCYNRYFELIEADVNYCVTLPCTTGRNVLGSTESDGQQGK